jgi:L-threonylcarbamoyladenylate synthase
MEILKPTDANLRRAAEALSEGRLVAFPTETVYGLGGNAYDATVLAKIFAAKGRPTFDPLIVHIASLPSVDNVADLSALSPEAAAAARALMAAFWPGPMTLILPKKPCIPDLATSGLSTVAVRFPNHPVAQRIIELSTGAIAAPSANPFGYLSPTRAEHVADQLGDKVDIILDGGRCSVGVESTVVDMTGTSPMILRPGGMSLERLRTVAPDIAVLDRADPKPKAPGQLPSHYAPRRPLRLVNPGELAHVYPMGHAAAIFFDRASLMEAEGQYDNFLEVKILSESGDLVEAAANLFDFLHELDKGDFDEYWAERVPNEGIGAAVNDRLYKASKK